MIGSMVPLEEGFAQGFFYDIPRFDFLRTPSLHPAEKRTLSPLLLESVFNEFPCQSSYSLCTEWD